MKHTTALILVIITLCSLAIPVAAVTPRYTYTGSVYALLDINSLGVAHCRGNCIAYDAVKVVVKLYLQYYSETTESWNTLKIWQHEDVGACAIDAYYAVYSGFQFRVQTIGYVYNSYGAIVEVVSATDYFTY